MFGIKIPYFIQLIKARFADNEIKTIIDIGCNDGSDTKLFKESFINSRVIGIEGSPKNYDFYRLKDQKGIEFYKEVISNIETERIFYQAPGDGGQSGLNSLNHKIESFKIFSTTVENFCLKYDIDQIDIAKIDTEGSTFEVLDSFGAKMLSGIKMLHIETEENVYFPGQTLAFKTRDFLIDNGFMLVYKKQAFANVLQFDEIWIKK